MTTTRALHIDLSGRTPPSEFRIFKRGVNSSVKGDFLFDDQAASLVMAAYRGHGVDLPIDFDHSTLSAGSGVKAIAAGWFDLTLRDGSLYATNVRWTDEGASDLKAGRYRYFSPLFDVDGSSGRIEKLINVGLTNTPALIDIEALVAASADHSRKDHHMKAPTEILRKIGERMFNPADRAKFRAHCDAAGDTRQRSLGAGLSAVARRGAPSSRSTVVALSQTGGTKTEEEKIAAKLGVMLSPADRERLRTDLARGSR